MKAIIDTSSLLAFVRYYIPFDENSNLKEQIKNKIENDELIIIDKVVEESKRIKKGIILKSLNFIENSKKIIPTETILPDATFFNQLKNNFCNTELIKLKGLNDTEFEKEKNYFLNSADAKLILYALKFKADNICIVSEETLSNNDNKIFKKIPFICNMVDIKCCTLPEFLQDYFKIKIIQII